MHPGFLLFWMGLTLIFIVLFLYIAHSNFNISATSKYLDYIQKECTNKKELNLKDLKYLNEEEMNSKEKVEHFFQNKSLSKENSV